MGFDLLTSGAKDISRIDCSLNVLWRNFGAAANGVGLKSKMHQRRECSHARQNARERNKRIAEQQHCHRRAGESTANEESPSEQPLLPRWLESPPARWSSFQA